MEDHLIEIETKLAYQEDMVEQLNKALSDQQRQIDQLRDTCRVMVERFQQLLDEGAGDSKTVQEKPPHY